jgi:hypothetical protein
MIDEVENLNFFFPTIKSLLKDQVPSKMLKLYREFWQRDSTEQLCR